MSIDLDQAFITAFDSEVKQAYQGAGKLRETVTLRNNIGGSSYQFQKMGEMQMQDHSPQTDITPADVSHSNQTVTLTDKRVGDYTDRFDDDKANIDERQELASLIGKAMGRQEDQTIYDTIDNGSYSGDQEIQDTFGSNNGLNVEKLREAKKHFDKIEAPREDRCLVHTPKAKMQLLANTEVASQDYNQVKALVDGEADNFLGFTFKEIPPSRNEGGITVSSDIANNYAYHKPSVGMALGTGPETLMSFHEEKYSWLTQGVLSLGAVLRDTEGQVLIETDQSVDVSQGA